MGTVYLARSRGGRPVAVKVARPELAADPHFRERFRAEVAAARKVGGFHTAPVVDADPEAAAPWLATAYVPGPTLSGLLAEQGPMDEDRLRLLGAALAEALQAVHACGLVHRDLKPGNIIMAEDGPRVLDFGIARAVESTRLTSTGAAFGTPGFLAPEQAQGAEVDGGADVFALGAVLVAAAGGSAFGAGTPMALMYRSVHEPADLSTVPQGLRPVVAACLAKDPADRPTPAKLLDLFVPGSTPYTPTVAVPAEASDPAPARPGTAPAPYTPTAAVPTEAPGPASVPSLPSGPSRRRTLSLGLVLAAVIAALVGGTYLLMQKDDHQNPPSAAASGPSGNPSATETPSTRAPAPSTPPAATGDSTEGKVTVVVSTKERSAWLSAKASDGGSLFDGVLQAGQTRTFTDGEQISLVLGDAEAFRLVVNGKPIQETYEPGQVERLTFTPSEWNS
ncbi:MULTISPECIES: RodZ domain-containing protein [unclassified Streptomyces]|uniref:RodZ domain-containing protein n=1 Tax=unclassified Streptomyces TaxID=2593676 RepID=UPI001F5BDBE8|nr:MULTISPECIES: RodZ domain-containing protein [unclassified Streptomyces]